MGLLAFSTGANMDNIINEISSAHKISVKFGLLSKYFIISIRTTFDITEIKKHAENFDECKPPENFRNILKTMKKHKFSKNSPNDKPIISVTIMLSADSIEIIELYIYTLFLSSDIKPLHTK